MSEVEPSESRSVRPRAIRRFSARVYYGKGKTASVSSGHLRRLSGRLSGTEQAEAAEEVRALRGWRRCCDSAGLDIEREWADRHDLSWARRRWRYQVYFACRRPATPSRPPSPWGGRSSSAGKGAR